MSRMIPPYYNDESTSSGEKKLYRALEALAGDYTIIHSLGVAQHKSKLFAEIDFVVICKEGIMVLEVKSGDVYRKDGVWCYVDRFGNENYKTESPFQQAVSGMNALRENIRSNFRKSDSISLCQFASGVAFPDIPFNRKEPDVISEIVFDNRNAAEDLESYIKSVFGYWRGILEERHGFQGGKLSSEDIKRVANYLRGDFGFVPPFNAILDQTHEELLILTQEQIERLAMAGENPRILLKGAAGTGKTLLSLEHAKRAAFMGKSVLYLCYNKSLGKYLNYYLEQNQPEIYPWIRIQNFHNYLSEQLDQHQVNIPADAGEDFYTRLLPETFCQAVRDGRLPVKIYDLLVIDEGQDLLTLEYLECMDLLVRDGLDDGGWHICYDSNQNIYNPYLDDGLAYLDGIHHINLSLDTNCRNTKPIGMFNAQFTQIPPAKFLKVDGPDVEKNPFTDRNDLRKKLLAKVKELLKSGVNPGEIYILSPYKFENSSLEGNNIFINTCSFQDATHLSPKLLVKDTVKFSTIHSFKGLEAKVILLIDVSDITSEKARLLIYTAISRATALLHVFYNIRIADEVKKLVG